MKIKEMLGYCACKGCKNKYVTTMIISGFDKEFKIKKKKIRVCERHAKELCFGGKR